MVDRPFHREEWLAQDIIDPVVGGSPQAQSLTRDIAFRQCGLVPMIEADMTVDIQSTGEFRRGLQPVSG